jgi:hypothetical protein
LKIWVECFSKRSELPYYYTASEHKWKNLENVYNLVLHFQNPAPVIENMLMETSEHSVNEEVLFILSSEQRLLLDQQMRKHVQLTTQHFLQTYAHPQLSHCASECKGILVSYSVFQLFALPV